MGQSTTRLRRLVSRLRALFAYGGEPRFPIVEQPRAALSSPDSVPADSTLADWKRYAAELEHELEHAAIPASRPVVVHYKIAASSDEAAATGAEGPRPTFDFGLDPGAPQGPRATVIIPVYNDVEMTIACLRSLAEHPPSTVRTEYVVVDDASPMGVASQLASIAGLTVLRNAENVGFLRTCNRAALLSTASYLVFLNNDTLVRNGWLDELVRTAESDPRVGVVGSKLVYPDGTLQEAGGLIWRDACGWNYGRGSRADDPAYEFVRDVDYCSGAALLVRRSLWTGLGGFDERFAPAYFEDSDLCFAARRAGFRVVYQPRSVVVHLEGGTGGTDVGIGAKRNQVVNHPKFRQKWFDVLETQHMIHDASQGQRAARRLQGSRIVLMIDNYVPEPDRDSGSNKIVHIIRLLRELGWHVMYMPDNYHASQPYTNDLQQLGVEVFYHIDGGPTQQVRLHEALSLADLVWIGRPDLFAKYREHFERNPDLPIVYDTHDLHFVRAAREIEMRGGDATDEDRRKQLELKKQELDIARTVDVILTVTELEKDILESEGADNVCVVPNIHIARTRALAFEQTDGILFIGGYNHTPNVDAVEWLVQEVMPSVWNDFPKVRVTLLGSNPPPAVWELGRDPRVVVTGYISNVDPYFESARIFVAPLRYGAGLKGKIGQSLEYGLPVVTTPIGAEGFDFVDGRDAIVADDADAFAKAIKRLYTDRVLWSKMSSATSAKLAPFFPERVKPRIAEVVAAAAERRRRRRAELVGA